ncbi:MAG TPA: HlyD family type I secretion periplasmic adaptor subunit [Beijerinckiaceae bacterium]|nr:HlyD family type I secretion periplasmic adaptor subunit [Rhodoblastus sp.]MCB1525542.1 HlyD family type I secretion periplasmic adaptor subunit [Rhodoblastus sp.]MCC2108367.1 HlyD family type I secretion periplasmic adaptor subunit [Hyphomicrobiales bacterium]HRY01898.1 HlyD family type I secretion periplasmic adaptor subunit [Beijerinckiaceae bacterium]
MIHLTGDFLRSSARLLKRAPDTAAPLIRRPSEGGDREFLPAALEILETPPSPIAISIAATLAALVACAFLWSILGHLDVVAVAPGKIEVSGRSKTIQPFDQGKIAAIHIANGAKVQAGDLLIEMDPTEARADAAAAIDLHDSARAEAQRRRAAILAAATPAIQTPQVAFSAETPPDTAAREQAVLAADLAQLRSSLAEIDSQQAQKIATRDRLIAAEAVDRQILDTTAARVAMRERAIALDIGTKVNLFDAREQHHKAQAQLASDRGQLIEAKAALDDIAAQKDKTRAQFVADNETKAADALRRVNDADQQRKKAIARLLRTKIQAPVSGTIQQLAATTVGQVVTPGQQIAIISPAATKIVVDAYVSNIDIGFVHEGQEAQVKIDAFPFTRFGVIKAHVTKIAPEAIDEQEARRVQANATAGVNAAQQAGGATPGPPNFVFPVQLELEDISITVGARQVPLTPGMTVQAEIATDKRRIIEYLLSPIARTTNEAMRER